MCRAIELESSHAERLRTRFSDARVRAALLIEPGPVEADPLEIVELPDPEPGFAEIVIAVSACGVCRTDLQIVEGDLAPRLLPVIPGHQAVGHVVAVGEGVEGWRVADRAGVAWVAGTDETCRFCVTGRENLCEQASFTGWDRHGGFADLVTVAAGFAHPLPAGPGDLDLAPLLCGGVIGYRALKVSEIEPGGSLGLFGFGASALLALQVALYWRCEVYVVTRSKPEQTRALEMGAAWAGSYAGCRSGNSGCRRHLRPGGRSGGGRAGVARSRRNRRRQRNPPRRDPRLRLRPPLVGTTSPIGGQFHP